MNDIMKLIREAYDLLSSIPVSGQSVDAMYAVRAKMRNAYSLAETKSKEQQETPVAK